MRQDLKYELVGIIPEELIQFIPHSFDIIGGKGDSVAIIEIPLEIENYEKEIAEALVRVHRNVRSVLSKGTERRGELRIRNMKFLYGNPNTEVTHRENGYLIRIDPAKVYFSPRECTERENVAKFVQSNEDVLVMFSGAGPYAVCIAKRNPSVSVTAVELSPFGNKFCEENIKLNKLVGRVKAIQGDVRDVCPIMGQIFDRVFMPLPKGAYLFLDVALRALKPGGALHFYHWSPRGELFEAAEKILIEAVKAEHRSAEILNKVKVSQYSPSTWKIRLDARIF